MRAYFPADPFFRWHEGRLSGSVSGTRGQKRADLAPNLLVQRVSWQDFCSLAASRARAKSHRLVDLSAKHVSSFKASGQSIRVAKHAIRNRNTP